MKNMDYFQMRSFTKSIIVSKSLVMQIHFKLLPKVD